jgi:diacylglycerol kinase family enzyme
MRVLVLVNRRARGFSSDRLRRYLGLMRDMGSVDVVSPMGPRELVNTVSASGAQYDIVVVVGGDGTVGLVATALRNTGTPLLAIPMGRGNTFYRVNYRDEEPALIIRSIARGFGVRRIDLGMVHEFGRCFVLGASAGLMAEVARAAGHYWLFGGRRSYVIAGLERTVLSRRRINAIITADGSVAYDGEITYCSLGLTPVRAGGVVIFPRASITDGLLDYLIVPRLGRLELLRTRMGLIHPGVVRGQGSRFSIRFNGQFPVEVDGDFMGLVESINVSSLPSSLSIAVPSEWYP